MSLSFVPALGRGFALFNELLNVETVSKHLHVPPLRFAVLGSATKDHAPTKWHQLSGWHPAYCSYQTVLYRLSEILPIGNGIWSKFRILHEKGGGRPLSKTDEPRPLEQTVFSAALRSGEPENISPLDFAHDRLHRLVRQALEEKRISVSRGAEILSLSILGMRDIMSGWIQEPPPKTR